MICAFAIVDSWKIQSEGLRSQYETVAEFTLTEVIASVIICGHSKRRQYIWNLLRGEYGIIGYPTNCGQLTRTRRLPRFPYDMWNFYETVLEGLPIMKNCRKMASSVRDASSSKPSEYTEVRKSLPKLRIEQYVWGLNAPRCAQRVEVLVTYYDREIL